MKIPKNDLGIKTNKELKELLSKSSYCDEQFDIEYIQGSIDDIDCNGVGYKIDVLERIQACICSQNRKDALLRKALKINHDPEEDD